MYNKAILMGRITKDLELKTTPSGVSVLSFSIAVDRKYQAKGEEKKTDFFNCVAWRNEAEFIARWFAKGKMILVEGELQNRTYDDNNGITRYVTELIVDRATFTGEKSENAANGSQATPYQPPQVQPATAQASQLYQGQQPYQAPQVQQPAPLDPYPFY